MYSDSLFCIEFNDMQCAIAMRSVLFCFNMHQNKEEEYEENIMPCGIHI